MLPKRRLTELMATADPKLYRKYIIINKKGEAIMYVNMHKAFYGLTRSALLLYLKLVTYLEAFGF